MKQFAIINGKHLMILSFESLSEACEKSIAICDHSKEILVRELTETITYDLIVINPK